MSAALFGNSARSASKNLVEFRAGKMVMKGKMVHPDKRKGLAYVYQADDTLMHFCWKDRSTGTVEEDLIIFPDDCDYKKVSQCTTGRVFVLRFKSNNRRLFFWMQEPKTEKDDDFCRKVNEYLNNPPTPGSQRSSSSTPNPVLGSSDLSNLQNSDIHNFIGNISQQQLMQILGSGVPSLATLLGPKSDVMIKRWLDEKKKEVVILDQRVAELEKDLEEMREKERRLTKDTERLSSLLTQRLMAQNSYNSATESLNRLIKRRGLEQSLGAAYPLELIVSTSSTEETLVSRRLKRKRKRLSSKQRKKSTLSDDTGRSSSSSSSASSGSSGVSASTTTATTTSSSSPPVTTSTTSSSTTSSTSTSTSSTNNSGSALSSGSPSIQLSDLQNILSGIKIPLEGSERVPVDLGSVMTAEALQPILTNADFVEQLRPFLPTTSDKLPPVEELRGTVSSPQFQQAVNLFTSALQSGQLGPLINQFGLGEEAVMAATSCDMEAFIKALGKVQDDMSSKKEESKKKEKDQDKDEDDSMALD